MVVTKIENNLVMEGIIAIIGVFALLFIIGFLRYYILFGDADKKINQYYNESSKKFIADAMNSELKKEAKRKHLYVVENDLDLIYSRENNIPYSTVKEWHKACNLMDEAYMRKGKAAEDDEYEIFKTIKDKAGWLKYSEWFYQSQYDKVIKSSGRR